MMHRGHFIVMGLSLLLSLAACTTDEYEKGDGELSYMRADFADVRSGKAGFLSSFITDEGDSLSLVPTLECSWATTPDSVYRALVYYNRENSADIQVEGIVASQVLVMKIPSHRRDTVVMHPVGWESAWLSANGKYLNMGIDLKTGKGDDDKARQTLGVVRDTTLVLADGTSEHHLRLYHDQGRVPEYYTTKVYVSIPVAGMSVGDVVRLEVNTYDGLVTRTFPIVTKAR